jgi:hypothetical protein
MSLGDWSAAASASVLFGKTLASGSVKDDLQIMMWQE